MRLTVFNGSPRGRRSNTRILLRQLCAGFAEGGGDGFEQHYLKLTKQRTRHVEAFARADCVLLAFPLYVHAMPGQVKELVEQLVPRDPADRVRLGFLVQQGFPETHQSSWLRPWLDRLPARLGCQPLGTVVKGGVEGIQIMPPVMTRKLFGQFRALGEQLARDGRFDEAYAQKLAEPVRISPGRQLLHRALSKVGLTNYYWDSQLKKRGAFERRFARPYLENSK